MWDLEMNWPACLRLNRRQRVVDCFSFRPESGGLVLNQQWLAGGGKASMGRLTSLKLVQCNHNFTWPRIVCLVKRGGDVFQTVFSSIIKKNL